MPMRSISSKLILAFLSIGVVSVLIIVVTAIWSTRAEFIRFLTDQTQNDVVTQLSDYHRTYGSWKQAESIFNDGSYGNESGQPGMGPGPHMRKRPFALADEYGRILIPNGPYHRGETISEDALEEGIPIT